MPIYSKAFLDLGLKDIFDGLFADLEKNGYPRIRVPEPIQPLSKRELPKMPSYEIEEDEDKWEEEYDLDENEPNDGEPEDEGDDYDGYDDYDGIEREEPLPVKEPPSIFDNLEAVFGKKKEEPTKNPFVFIANRLTFLIKTTQPIIWDTSTIKAPTPDCLFVAFDKWENPMMDFTRAVEIAHKVNCDESIQYEIREYLKDTAWSRIYCVPHTMEIDGEDRLGFMFAITAR